METREAIIHAAQMQQQVMSAAAWVIPALVFGGLAIWRLFTAYNK